MTDTYFIQLVREALLLVLILALPALAAAMLVGLVISILQATTQIQEQSLTFVPKIVTVFVVLAILTPWLLKVMTTFTSRLFEQLPMLVR